jgi:hypothetical protein
LFEFPVGWLVGFVSFDVESVENWNDEIGGKFLALILMVVVPFGGTLD